MPTTDEYWDVDGVSLNEQVQNLTSAGGSREGAPPLRGANVVIPGRPGEIWVPKTPDARLIELSGWMVGKTAQELKTRWRAFRALLWRPDEQFQLTRRWRDANGVARQGTALAEYVSGLEPIMMAGSTRAEFRVTVRLAEAFFFGAEELLTPSLTKTETRLQLKALGDYPSPKVRVELTGMIEGARFAVQVAGATDNELRYSKVDSGAVATIDVERFRATEFVAPNTSRSSGKVSHTGRTQWLYLPVKQFALMHTRTSGAGAAKVFYRPAWH